MPQTPRDYAFAALMVAAAAFVIAGAIVFQDAVSFVGYIGALLLLALAALSYLGARELKPKGAKDTRQDATAIKGEETTNV